MLKYVNTQVTFAEVPDEITLCINISNCPCRCDGCHSSYLADDIGTELDVHEIDELIRNNYGITCIAFMGGDADPIQINTLAKHICQKYKGLKNAWYSGRNELPSNFNLSYLSYLKLGPYIAAMGGLNSPNTNQRFYRIENGLLTDITSKFRM